MQTVELPGQVAAEAEQSQGGADTSDANIMWPSQHQENSVTASAQQAKAKANTEEKAAALARKRALFDKQFPVNQAVPQTKNKAKDEKWDPLIEKGERDKAWNLGHSLDSKKVTSALGYLDLKQICYCLAQALMKHIEFSQSHFFLGDLQEHIKQEKLEQSSNVDNIKNE